MRSNQNSSIRVSVTLMVFFTLLFAILFFRFFYLQYTGTADGNSLQEKAMNNYLKLKDLPAHRGTIFDRNGYVVAEDSISYTLVAVLSPKAPSYVQDKAMTAEKLSQYISMDSQKILERLNLDSYQVEFGSAGKNLSNSMKLEIEKLELPGIKLDSESKRFYPNGVFSSHVFGYVEKKVDESTNKTITEGMLGLEKQFNDQLNGTDGKIEYQADVNGRVLPDKEKKITNPKNGNNITTTIDKKIQTFLEESMTKINQEFKPQKMIAIVADPKTGAILAMSQRPTFNMNTKEGLDATWHNLAIEETYEPGSTFKVITLAGAVNEGVFNPDETYPSGSYSYQNSTPIHDWNYVGWGEIPYIQAVERSSNVGFAKLAMEKLGEDKFQDYISRFGFDKPTGIDLQLEVKGNIPYNRPIQKVTTSFGQGIAITPIEQIQAFTAIAGNGKMMRPYIVQKIVDSDTKEVLMEKTPEVAGEPISAETAAQVRNYLETVITGKYGTGRSFAMDDYSVVGKTGTAQLPNPNGGGYLSGPENYLFSFIGMAPKDDPQVIMYVAIQQPVLADGKRGEDATSSIFKNVMENTLKYLSINGESKPILATYRVQDYKSRNWEDVKAETDASGIASVIVGSGDTIIAQVPESGTQLLQGEKMMLLTEGARTAPDLTGWSLKDVMQLAELLHVKLNYTGEGYVSKQVPGVDVQLNEGDPLVVELAPPITP